MNHKHNTFARLHLIKPTGMILLVIHLFIALSYTFFLHTHTLETGEKVVHSHPLAHNDSDDENHHHNSSVYQILPDLQHYLEQSTPSGIIVATIVVQISTYKAQSYSSKILFTPYLRGPPSELA